MVTYRAEDDIAATGKGMRPEVKALLDNVLSRPMTAQNDRKYPQFGWKALLGVIHPNGSPQGAADFKKLAPPGVDAVQAWVPVHKNESTEEMMKLSDHVVEVAGSGVFRRHARCVTLALHAGSFLKGAGFDLQLIDGMKKASGVQQATTTSTAIVAAFKELGVKKLAMCTPYPRSANELEKKFIEAHGIELTRCEGFEFVDFNDMQRSKPHDYYEFGKLCDTPDADAVFISCTGIDVLEVIEPLEKTLGKPVITSNQASYWHAFKLARVGRSGTRLRYTDESTQITSSIVKIYAKGARLKSRAPFSTSSVWPSGFEIHRGFWSGKVRSRPNLCRYCSLLSMTYSSPEHRPHTSSILLYRGLFQI